MSGFEPVLGQPCGVRARPNLLQYAVRLVVAFLVLFIGFAVESLGERFTQLGNWLQTLAIRIEGDGPGPIKAVIKITPSIGPGYHGAECAGGSKERNAFQDVNTVTHMENGV